MKARPFIKWAGGKKQLLVPFQELYPKSWFSYFEPFIGGGAVFFDVWDKGNGGGVISDLNPRLIQTYRAIQFAPGALAKALAVIGQDGSQDAYYDARTRYNNLEILHGPTTVEQDIEIATLFIYLNKNGFNGLYRVNKKGGFNVPWGHRKKAPALPSLEHLRAVHDTLASYDVVCSDFMTIVSEQTEAGDFVYLDPPYVPLSPTANFTAYTAGGFGDLDQRNLAKVFVDLTARDVQVMLSNHDTPELRKLYSDIDCHITVVPARRSINRNGAKRGPVNEVVIRNYR